MWWRIFSLLFFILCRFNFSSSQALASDELTMDDGKNVLSAYDDLMETVAPQETIDHCYESPAVSDLSEVESVFCRQDIVEAAAGFFYLKDTKARSNLWRSLKGFQGPWRKKEFYPNNIISNIYDYTLTIRNRDDETIVITFPKTNINEPIRVEVTNKDGAKQLCSAKDSSEILRMSSATLKAWTRLSDEQRQEWKKFCLEHSAYEEKAQLFEKNDWTMMVPGQSSDRDKIETYNRCPAGLEWKRVASEALCNGASTDHGGFPFVNPNYKEYVPNLTIPKSFMYFFDGYGDFNAEKALERGHAENVTGREKGDMVMGAKNANGLNFYLYSIGNDHHQGDIQFLYYDGTGQKASHNARAAANCHRDMDSWLKVIRSVYPDIEMPKRVAMGYSNGGAASLGFQKMISKKGLFSRYEETQLDLLLTVDPISRPASYVLNRATGLNLLSKRSETTARYINIYQDSDYGSMPPLKLTSQAAPGADENLYLSQEEFGDSGGHFAHVNILYKPEVLDRARCEFDRVLEKDFSTFCSFYE